MATATAGGVSSERQLRREVGYWGLTFVSLGSIIGSGWLLGALTAASSAGPASILSWILAAVMLATLALVHCELGAAYPVAGGTARFPYFAFGHATGFTAGWIAYLQAVPIAAIEVEAVIAYSSHISWVGDNITMLHENGTLTASGLLVATVLMVIFTVVNIVGVKLMSDSNAVTVIWKTAIPVLTVIVLLSLSFHSGNFSAGGGFNPFGAHGIFAALPLGVVFALQGFEQAIQMAGEAKKPQRDLPRAVITAAAIGTVVYLALELAFIGSLNPANLAHGWANPIGKGDFGPYATLATAAGATWLAYLLYADAVISPGGTGLVYTATSSRLAYALGREKQVPEVTAKVSRTGVPWVAIIISFVIGELALLPFPSWKSLVGLVTDATAMMYAFAPIALTALRMRDPDRPRPYKLPAYQVVAPIAFVFANLIVYWSGYEANWKIGIAIVLGLIIYLVTQAVRSRQGEQVKFNWANSVWVWPWLIGTVVIGYFGRYGNGARNSIPEWIDLLVVIVWSLIIYFFALNLAVSSEEVNAMVAAEEEEIATSPELNIG